MKTKLLSGVAILLALGTGAFAQSSTDRAAAAADGAVNTGTMFRLETVDDVVTPFETATPPEAGMSHTSFEDRILQTRDAYNDQGRVLRATEDSAAVRPGVDIDGQGQLFDDANWAHQNAADIAGRYFSSETGNCSTPDLPVSEITDEFCESMPRRRNTTCDLVRQIWADRTDIYRCDQRAARYVKVCEQDISYTCRRNSNCIQNNVQVTNVESRVWDGDSLTIRVRGSGQYRVPGLVQETIKIRISDQFAPEEVRVSHVDANGYVQVLDHRGVLQTFAPEPFQTASAQGGMCPTGDDDGLLVPLTKYGTARSVSPCAPAPDQYFAAITKTPVTRTHYDRGYSFQVPENSGPTVFESGWDVTSPWQVLYHVKWDEPEGSSDRNYEDCITRYVFADQHCYMLAPLQESQSFNRTTLRWLDLEFYDTADPETGKRYFDNDLTLRMVTLPGREAEAEATIKIEFQGSCCNVLQRQVTETCE